MRFLVDMNLSVHVAAALRAEGHDAVHLRELGLQRLDDRAILAKAKDDARIVLTFDLDFGDLAAAGAAPVGVVLFRLRSARTSFVLERLQATLRSRSRDLEQGAVVIVEEARLRVRRLPLGS